MIRILTDSAADLTAKEAAAIPGLHIVPLNVLFEDGETIRDGIDMTRADFYDRLQQADKLPRTSQPSPESFIQVFEEAKAAGDEVVAILISSKLSGTFQCAKLAAEDCEFNDVYFVDSDTASPGEYILIQEAVRLRDEGVSAAEIAAALDLLKKRIRILAVVDTCTRADVCPPLWRWWAEHWASNRCCRCMTARSIWPTKPAAVPAPTLPSSSRWTRWAVLIPATTSSWSIPATSRCWAPSSTMSAATSSWRAAT